MGKGGNESEKKPDNIVKLRSEGGYAEVARDLEAELMSIIEQDQTLHITDEEVDTRKELLLQDEEGRAANLESILEASIRQSEKSLFTDRATVVYYLAAARAYQEIPAEEKRDADEVKG